MSYYETYLEIPPALLARLLEKPKDSNGHFKLLELFYEENEKRPVSGELEKLRYRQLCNGKLGIDWPPQSQELAFFAILNASPSWKQLSQFHALCGGYPAVSGYRTPEEVKESWLTLETILAHHPEFQIKDLMEPETDSGDGPTSWQDLLRFYFGAAKRGSAEIRVET
jgi:hypothetical protein